MTCVVSWISFSSFGRHSRLNNLMPYSATWSEEDIHMSYVLTQQRPIKVLLIHSGDICMIQQYFFHLGGTILVLQKHELLEMPLRSMNFQWMYLPTCDTCVLYRNISSYLLTWLISLVSAKLRSCRTFHGITRGSTIFPDLSYGTKQSPEARVVNMCYYSCQIKANVFW